MPNLFIGNANDIASKCKPIFWGDSNNVAHEVKQIYQGDENNVARLIYKSSTLVDIKIKYNVTISNYWEVLSSNSIRLAVNMGYSGNVVVSLNQPIDSDVQIPISNYMTVTGGSGTPSTVVLKDRVVGYLSKTTTSITIPVSYSAGFITTSLTGYSSNFGSRFTVNNTTIAVIVKTITATSASTTSYAYATESFNYSYEVS